MNGAQISADFTGTPMMAWAGRFKISVLAPLTAVMVLACQTTPVERKPVVLTEIGSEVRAVTFNIRIGLGTDNWGKNAYDLRHYRKHLQPIVDALNALNPDVAALQEVLGAGQASQIASGLGMDYRYVAHQDGWWGVAILSRYPIIECDRWPVSGNRSAIVCEVGDRKQKIAVASIHRDHQLYDGHSNQAIIRFSYNYSNMILMGDFNFPPSGPRYDDILRIFADTASVQTPSAAAARESGTFGFPLGRRIDYVFIRPEEFEVIEAGLAEYEYRHASDHRPYYADLRLK